MPRAPRVPAELTVAPFRAADAARVGLSREQLRSRAWRRLFRDVFVHAGLPDTAQLRLAAVRLLVPEGAVLTGLTAAWVLGALTPDPARPVPLHVATELGRGHLRIPGVRTSRLQLDAEDVVELEGVRVTSPERTCIDLARRAPVVEAVVAVDAFLRVGLVTGSGLWRYCAERPRWPGIDRAREAVLLSNGRSGSAGETRLRLVIVLGGLPEPLVNVTLFDEDGTPVGTPDLLYLNPLFGCEYDGAYHRDPAVHQIDLRRENRLLTRGVPLLRYSAYDLAHRRSFIIDEVSAGLAGRLTA